MGSKEKRYNSMIEKENEYPEGFARVAKQIERKIIFVIVFFCIFAITVSVIGIKANIARTSAIINELSETSGPNFLDELNN